MCVCKVYSLITATYVFVQFSSFDTTKYKNRYKLGFETNFKGVGIPGFELYVGWTSKSLKSTESEKLKAFCVT